MKKITIEGVTLEYYDAIEELPIKRYHKYNKMLMIDAGIGNDLFDADGRIERAMRFVQIGDSKNANKELSNLRNLFYMMQTEMSPKFRAFAALVKSINGVQYDDISDDGIATIIEHLDNLSVSFVTATLEAVKKKISTELKLYFPKTFDDAETKDYYTMVKRRIMSMLEGIINENDTSEEVEEIETKLLTFSKPFSFSGEESAEITCDKDFEGICHFITENTGSSAKNLSVLEFYSAYEYAKQKVKAKASAYKAK